MENKLKLGFGLMRLPKLEDGSIDVEQVKTMVDLFLEAGGTYFDTAFVYEGSEEAIRKALIERHPRDTFTLATKLNGWRASTKEEAEQQFVTSLERTQAGYFDYYLLHSIRDTNYPIYEKFGLWDFVREQKEKGLIKHYGFSFHDTPDLLDRILTEHPDVDFVQLQINYADWENPAIASRGNWEVARKHGKQVVIMEPVKGGILAELPNQIGDRLKSYAPEASIASWGIRFAASLDGILAVLSGMSNIAQMQDNLSYMKDFKPLSEEEQELIRLVQDDLNSLDRILCTSCHYCEPGCPMNIPIPKIFGAWNMYKQFNKKENAISNYNINCRLRNKASACIQCGQCEGACPQHLPIISLLETIAKEFEG
ncbi:MAG: aldo/keto reductase [Solobacterium sp.]|nr:aldo/keto reductase [Solobacterium sp.]